MNTKFKWTMLILFILLLLACVLSFNLGAISISPTEVFYTFVGKGTEKQNLILFEIRLPSTILAIIVGAAMAVSGTILQVITKNELADPGILGINAGAGIAVVLYITFFQSTVGSLSGFQTFILPLVSFLGAILTAGIIMALAWKQGVQSTRLILVGIGINAGFGAILIALQLRLNPQDFVKTIVWLSGDLWATQWPYVWALLPWIIVFLIVTFWKANTLNIMNLGSLVATGVGIRASRERVILFGLSVGMAGLGVAAGGGIAFLGLIAPHIARRLVGLRHQFLLPASAFIGALILVIADTLGKNILSPTEIPAGLVVSLISVPYFIYLLIKTK